MHKKKSSDLAVMAMFAATMLVVHYLTITLFSWLTFLPIQPTLVHIPVIIASIVYGPRLGLSLGLFMGIISVVTNTIILKQSSMLFSPFVEGGNIYSLIVAIVPRLLIGITPYYSYKLLKNKVGLGLAGAIGSATNTIFVLGGIFLFFQDKTLENMQKFLAGVASTNAVAELIISVLITLVIVPRLLVLAKK